LSSNGFSKLGRVAASVMLLLGVLGLASCQVRPLYSEASGTTEKLNTVSFEPVSGRIAQDVRNRLIFLAYGGAGAPVKAEYEVKLAISSSASTTAVTYNDNLSVSRNVYEGPFPGRVIMSGTYTLTRVSDGQVLRTATRTVTTMLDLPQQEFAEMRAIRDGESRAGRELAEIIRTDIAATLSR
jgi:LPS-assembly lipoprotein